MEELTPIWPHDLLVFKDKQDLILSENPLPGWAKDSLAKASIVVVRRGKIQHDLIPVGIRGYERNQRLAAFLKQKAIKKQYHPDYFIRNKSWQRLNRDRQELPAFRALRQVATVLKDYHWGIGGSLAYEMATGLEMVKNTSEHASDMDLLLYFDQPMSKSKAQSLLQKLNQFKVHADLQVVKGENGFSLEEFAISHSRQVLVKTAAGPILTTDPWQFLKENK